MLALQASTSSEIRLPLCMLALLLLLLLLLLHASCLPRHLFWARLLLRLDQALLHLRTRPEEPQLPLDPLFLGPVVPLGIPQLSLLLQQGLLQLLAPSANNRVEDSKIIREIKSKMTGHGGGDEDLTFGMSPA